MAVSRWAVYKGKKYPAFNVKDDFITLRSENKDDLNNGFYMKHSEEYHKQHSFYCIKTVSISELTSLTETRYTFVYKGEPLTSIGGTYDDNGKIMHLLGHKIDSPVPEEYPDLVDEYIKYLNDGFEKRIVEKTFCYMVKAIYEDDPDLKIIEDVHELID
jgi:hypothetical protein